MGWDRLLSALQETESCPNGCAVAGKGPRVYQVEGMGVYARKEMHDSGHRAFAARCIQGVMSAFEILGIQVSPKYVSMHKLHSIVSLTHHPCSRTPGMHFMSFPS